ncbi:hypothetical protein ACNTMW_18345 [Planosporangium sp. 12N6]|uniref:hypothetical protein n=1 Tax=Planosporangium spinosum TaxID=3402278 RepID=UPI003CEB489F
MADAAAARVGAAVMRRLAGLLWAGFWLFVLLVGLPAVLVRYVGWPLPEHWPTGADWERWAARPLTRTTVVGAGAVLGWLLWALLVYAVLVELLTRLRRAVGWSGRLRLPALPTPMQATASGMLGAAVFGLPAGTGQTPAEPVAAQPTAAPALPAVDGVPAAVPAQPPAGPAPGDLSPTPGLAHGHPAPRGGVELADGSWVADDTATATVAAAALVWLRRRRRYRPRPPTGAVRDDPDLAPLPATVAAIHDGLHRHQAGDDTDDEPEQPTAEPAGTGPDATSGQPARQPLRPHQLPAGGLGLTGAGAAAAARGLLAAILLTGAGGRPGAGPRVVATAADLAALLGPAPGAVPGLTVVDSLDEALGHLERAVLDRTQSAATRRDHRPADPAGRPTPAGAPAPLVLLAGCPTDPAAARRLAVLLTLAAPLGITGVLLGAWPHGHTWLVDTDGTTHPTDTPEGRGPRLSVLTVTATVDLLALLREAHPVTVDAPTLPAADHRPAPAPVATASRSASPATGAAPGGGVAPARPPLRLTVLGAPAIHRTIGDTAAVPVRRRAAWQVLVFLAVRRDGATSGELAGALWPGLRPHAATGRLYTPISDLRTALRETAGADVIVRDGGHYRLDDRYVDVDLWRLHAAVEDAATALDPAARQRALRTVADAYTGELAAGQHWPWLAMYREAVRRHVIDAYVALATAEPDPDLAAAFLQGALRTDPFNEDLQRRVRGRASAGDPSSR